MGGIAFRGYLKNANEVVNQADAAKEDTTHFLGQRNFGHTVILFNLMASFCSGFLMVFTPDAAALLGPAVFCWVSACNMFTTLSMVFFPMLARLGTTRNYLGPNDFVADRYQSFFIRFTTSFGGGFSTFMILTIEWMILKLITSWLFGGTGETSVWLLAIFIFLCETMGGMNSVSKTCCPAKLGQPPLLALNP